MKATNGLFLQVRVELRRWSPGPGTPDAGRMPRPLFGGHNNDMNQGLPADG
jgi:hypothetical protein